MNNLALAIPGLSQHRTQVRAPYYSFSEAKNQVDRVMAVIGDDIPDDLMEWLKVKHPDQLQMVMNAWREIEVCDQNRDMAGVKAACTDMIVALRRGGQMHNAAPVLVEQQGGLFNG